MKTGLFYFIMWLSLGGFAPPSVFHLGSMVECEAARAYAEKALQKSKIAEEVSLSECYEMVVF